MALLPQQQQGQQQAGRLGVYDRSLIESANVDKIEGAKTDFLLAFTQFDETNAADQLLSIIDTMVNFIRKYYPAADYKEDGHTILAYQHSLEKVVDAHSPALTRHLLREIMRASFRIWDHYALKLKVAFATIEKDSKKNC